jgi:hypothetical protein
VRFGEVRTIGFLRSEPSTPGREKPGRNYVPRSVTEAVESFGHMDRSRISFTGSLSNSRARRRRQIQAPTPLA